MLKIGEFSGLTGLSVKALRHYDRTCVLVPAEVDDQSGYRSYDESQVRSGVIIRALRDAGVPLAEVAEAVATGSPTDALAHHHAHLLREREREERAIASAELTIRALAAPVTVTERTMPAQPYVGQIIPLSVADDSDLHEEDANDIFGSLFARIQAAGLGPSGPFWTALRAGDRDTVELVCCWPTTREAPQGAGGPDSISAVLPARRELVAVWRPTGGEELPDGALHPAIVGLFDAIADRPGALDEIEVRQSVIGTGDDDYAVEVSVSIT